MARFISERKQKNTNYLHWALLLIIAMEFIRFPDVIGVPPVYLVTGFCSIFILFDLKKRSTINPIIIKIILLLIFFDLYTCLLYWGLDVQNERDLKAARHLGVSVKNCIEFLLFSIACTNLTELRKVILTITIAIFISAAFGLLMHYFGEPFVGIRDWLWQSRRELLASVRNGEERFLSGLSGTNFLFGYLMTAGPALALVCGRLSHFKLPWVIMFLSMFWALYLNAERAALLFSVLTVIALLIYWHFITIHHACIILAVVLSFFISNSGNIQSKYIYRQVAKEMTLADRFKNGGNDGDDRFGWWRAGVTSTIESPWIGPSHQEYVNAFFKSKSVVVDNPDRFIPFIHNSYLNPGAFVGVIGWLFVLIYLTLFKKAITQVFRAATEEKQEKIIFQAVPIIVLAPMLDAMFQNDSIFTGEATNLCLTGLLMSCCQIIHNRQSTRFNRSVVK